MRIGSLFRGYGVVYPLNMGGVGSGRKPREYPSEIVERVQRLYAEGMTVREIQVALPPGFKAQRLVERFVDTRRPAVARDLRGPLNHMWRGDEAGYAALHHRVETARGKPSQCDWCGATDGRFEWANISGHYIDTADYDRLCTLCHRGYDALRRRLTGQRTSPVR